MKKKPEPMWIGVARHNIASHLEHAAELAKAGDYAKLLEALLYLQGQALRLALLPLLAEKPE